MLITLDAMRPDYEAVVHTFLDDNSCGEQAQPQHVRVNARKLMQNGADILHATRHLDAEHALAGAGVATAMAHGADAADSQDL